MLYVSRLVGRNKIEITDTDDGVSETYTRNEIAETLNSGIKIEGVSGYWYECGGRRRYKLYAKPHSFGGIGARCSMLYGIRFNVTNGVLGSAVTRDDSIAVNAPIRLSKICHTVADYAFKDFDYGGRLTIIVENVKFSRASFQCSFRNVNVAFDLREADDKLAWGVYMHRLEPWYSDVLTEVLIDNEERFRAFLYEYACRCKWHPEPAGGVQELLDMAVSSPGSERLFLSRHKKEFKKLHDAFGRSIKIDRHGRYAKRLIFMRGIGTEDEMDRLLSGAEKTLETLCMMMGSLDFRKDAVQKKILQDRCGMRYMDELLSLTNMRNNKALKLLKAYTAGMGGSDSDCLLWLTGIYKTAFEFVKENWRSPYDD